MLGIFSSVGSFFSKIRGLFSGKAESMEKETIYEAGEEAVEEIHSIWDYLKFKENTQAFHINSVMGFEEWVSMEEIIRRIRELFSIEYKNTRSLYPYLKTMVDCGLLESIDVGGTRKWRKKDLIIKIEKKEEKKERPKKEEAAGEKAVGRKEGK